MEHPEGSCPSDKVKGSSGRRKWDAGGGDPAPPLTNLTTARCGPPSHTQKRAAQGAQTPPPTAAPGGCRCGFYSLSPHHSFLLYIWKGNDRCHELRASSLPHVFFAVAKGEVYIEMSRIHNHSPAGESWKFEMPFSEPGARVSSLSVRGGLAGVLPKLHPAGATCLKIRVHSGDRNLILWGKGVQLEDRKTKILLALWSRLLSQHRVVTELCDCKTCARNDNNYNPPPPPFTV